jgi:hypothetical protein
MPAWDWNDAPLVILRWRLFTAREGSKVVLPRIQLNYLDATLSFTGLHQSMLVIVLDEMSQWGGVRRLYQLL